MRQRPAARLLVVDAASRLLLFRFAHRSGALAGSVYWAPPGGGCDPGESFAQAACRELMEETGLQLDHPGPQIARRVVTFTMPDGEQVEADERYFLVRVPTLAVCAAGWTAEEREAVSTYFWWPQAELSKAAEQVWPEDVGRMLVDAAVWPSPG